MQLNNLIETYSKIVEIPINLVPLNEESPANLPICLSVSQIEELVKLSENIQKPIITSFEPDYETCKHYVITPSLPMTGNNYFLLAGPFGEAFNLQIASVDLNDDQRRDKREVVLEKMNALYSLILEWEKEAKTKLYEILTPVFHEFGANSVNKNAESKISAVLEQIRVAGNLDFIGIAEKTTDNEQLEVSRVHGTEATNLNGKLLYIGEGLIGKSFIMGKAIFWNQARDSQRVEFFTSNGLNPTHLFCIPAKHKQKVEGVIFGGNLRNSEISKPLITLLHAIANFLLEMKSYETEKLSAGYKKLLLEGLIDLTDIALTTENLEYFLYKVLDFFQILNKGCFACVSTLEHSVTSRGEQRETAVLTHQKLLRKSNLSQNEIEETLIVTEAINTVHIPIFLRNKLYGLFSVAFNQRSCLEQAYNILETIARIVNQTISSLKNTDERQREDFNSDLNQLLFESLKETNPEQYKLTLNAIEYLERVSELFNLKPGLTEKLRQACKAASFSVDFLQKYHLPDNVLDLLKSVYKSETPKTSDEILILTFIFNRFFNKGLPDLNQEMPSIHKKLLDLYNGLNKQKNYEVSPKREHKKEISPEEIEYIKDLTSVIHRLPLTVREKEILSLILEGFNNQEVGNYLNISIHTVKNHVTNLFKKLNVTDRVQAMAKIYRIKYGEED